VVSLPALLQRGTSRLLDPRSNAGRIDGSKYSCRWRQYGAQVTVILLLSHLRREGKQLGEARSEAAGGNRWRAHKRIEFANSTLTKRPNSSAPEQSHSRSFPFSEFESVVPSSNRSPSLIDKCQRNPGTLTHTRHAGYPRLTGLGQRAEMLRSLNASEGLNSPRQADYCHRAPAFSDVAVRGLYLSKPVDGDGLLLAQRGAPALSRPDVVPHKCSCVIDAVAGRLGWVKDP
jgi:hypothetical protein